MYSQRDEEVVILKYFQNYSDGRLLDIGAYDGKTFSNTRQLLLNGWGGVLVEPSPSVYASLLSLYGSNSKVSICTKGVGTKAGNFIFYNSGGDAVSSFDIDHVELWKSKGQKNFTPIEIEVVTWKDLFTEYGHDFDFINLDAEGWSVSLLQGLPFSTLLNLKMIVIEFDGDWQKVLDVTKPYGFREIHRTAENMIMVK